MSAKVAGKMLEKAWNNVQRYSGEDTAGYATMYINMRAYGRREFNISLTVSDITGQYRIHKVKKNKIQLNMI